MSDNIYDILSRFNKAAPVETVKPAILNEGKKPDFLDFDKDGDKKEPMKKALKDKEIKESTCNECGMYESKCACGEGNAFGAAVRKAKADGVQKGEKVVVGGKSYPVKEGFPSKEDAEKRMKEKEGKTSKGKVEKTATGLKHTRSYDDDDKDDKKDSDSKGEKRGRGRPKKYTDDKPRQERVTAKSRKKDRTAWSKKTTNESFYLPVQVAESIAVGKLNVYDVLSGKTVIDGRIPNYIETVYETIARDNKLDSDKDFNQIMEMLTPELNAIAEHCRIKIAEGFEEEEIDIDVSDHGEYDQEGDMAKDQLHAIEQAAEELSSLLDDEDNLPEWVQSKITKALDYLQASNTYMDQEKHDVDDQLDEKYMGFDKTVAAIKKGGSARNPAAVAAAIGRKKYGKEKFQKAAAAGKKLGEADVEESGLQAYLGKKKYGKEGMQALQQAGREGASKEKMAKIRARHDKMDEEELSEKAVSKQQQKFMGMAHAMQKGQRIKGASPELKKVARTMKKGDVTDFAKTKHAGLPKRVKAGKPVAEDDMEEGLGDVIKRGVKSMTGTNRVKDAYTKHMAKADAGGGDKERRRAVKALYVGGPDTAEKAFDKFHKEKHGFKPKRNADYDEMGIGEELKGGQKKIDMNKNGKLDAQDFKMLRKGKKKTEETTVAGGMAPVAKPMGKMRRRTEEDGGPGGIAAEKPYRDPKSGKMVTPPKGATQPPADSPFPPGNKRNAMPVKKAEAPAGDQAVAETDKNPNDKASKAAKSSAGGFSFGKGIYDSMNRELENMISESMSINTSMDSDGRKSISISAQDEDADKLAELLKMAGLGDGGDHGEHMDTCPSCGSPECECDMIDEVSQNSPDYPENMGAEQDEVYMIKTLAGGLNRPKVDQTTLPHTLVKTQKDDMLEGVERGLWSLYTKLDQK